MNNSEERLFHWNEKSILWYQNAANYGSYHEQLAKHLLPHMNSKSRVCDLGCGVGYLTKELAPFVKEITGCDSNPKAIEFLQQQIEEHHLDNVEAMLADVEQIAPPTVPYDAIILCLFGGLRTCYDQVSQWTDKKIIYISSIKEKHAFHAGYKKNSGETAEETRDFLIGRGLKFHVETMKLPFGQPLKSMEEAIDFVRHYDKTSTRQEIYDYLNEKLIIKQEDETYPFYLPNEKKLAMFVIERNEAE